MYSHATFSEDETTKRNTTWNMNIWNGYVVSWYSGRTKCVKLSTCESEFLSASEPVRNSLFLNNTSTEMLQDNASILLYADNQSCIKWIKNRCGYTAKTKDIGITYHYICEMYDADLLKIYYVGTKSQIADIFTKPLCKTKRRRLFTKIAQFSSSGEC